MRMRSLPVGLMVAGLMVLSIVAKADPESPKPSCSSCSVCSSMMQCSAMQSMKMEILDLENGEATLTTITDPAKVAEFHQTWDQCQTQIDKALKMSKEEAKAHLC